MKLNGKKIKIIVCGSRDIDDYPFIKREVINILKWIQNIFPEIERNDLEIVSGGARGVDSLAEKFAKDNNIQSTVIYADWEKLGKQAGFIRNIKMLEYIEDSAMPIVVAFHKDNSPGTAHTIENAKKKKYRIFEITGGWM